jgi:hypothetical protein
MIFAYRDVVAIPMPVLVLVSCKTENRLVLGKTLEERYYKLTDKPSIGYNVTSAYPTRRVDTSKSVSSSAYKKKPVGWRSRTHDGALGRSCSAGGVIP